GEYAGEVAHGLAAHGLRTEVDRADDTVGEKIRRAIVLKHPVVLVVGDTDVDEGTVGIRIRGEDEERGVSLGEAAERIGAFCQPPR
ncbi:MAG: His/Gly/Thr/Pro-type tRNA ligase C-terminal domain-containing protein, partial [Acidimicrobiia bacterium]|nr:His/Gly/Thr/Pro-type tRNA ligase C-terminal domain-containing protein [Acidimicrobiia bacterium]